MMRAAEYATGCRGCEDGRLLIAEGRRLAGEEAGIAHLEPSLAAERVSREFDAPQGSVKDLSHISSGDGPLVEVCSA
jgi:hypothetical protein